MNTRRTTHPKIRNSLFWKVSATLLFILILLGIVYVIISSFAARRYLDEVNQKLYGNIADSTVQVVKPLVQGKVDTIAVKDIMHSVMVINPSAEVYLLDRSGGIITFMAPNKKIKLDRVDLEPVKLFINQGKDRFIKGDDPRNPGLKKVFSAAPIVEAGEITGYLYIILASEEQAAVSNNLLGSYMLRLSIRLFFLSLLGTLVIGLLAIWFLTKNLRSVIQTVTRFKEGELNARVTLGSSEELQILGKTFNEMADTLESNINELKSVEMLRQELVANISHDLRTPLAIMQGYVETLQLKQGVLTQTERNRYLQIILDSSNKLKKLVAQLFEYSKLETNQIQPQKEAFLISDLASDILNNYKMMANEKNITLSFANKAEAPMVFADIGMVERVIQNLLDNALRYTPAGGEISLTLDNSGQSVKIQITDTGPGIAEKDQNLIFYLYHTSAERKGKHGTGLGLAIVKKILELHDTTIKVKSKRYEGTAFMFQLPLLSV